MQNTYKSPLKPTAKSIPARLHTSKPKSKQCVPSAAKPPQQIKRQVFNNQIYKNILSRMLCKNTIQQFLQQTSKFLILDDLVLKPYQKGYFDVKNSQDFPELGRAILRDGSFIRHFCKLLILKEPWREEELKRYFYERYKNEICEKKSYFDTFFKLQIKEESCNLSQSQQKMSVKKTPILCSTKKSYKSEQKIISPLASNKKVIQRQPQLQHKQTLEQVQLYQPEETTISVEACTIAKDVWQQGQSRAQTEEAARVQEEESQYVAPNFERITMRHRGQSQEQRERRLLGLVDQSRSKPNKHIRNNPNQIIRFVDQIEANQRLKEIYESVKKERQQIQRASPILKENRKQEDDRSPIKRLSYLKLQKQFQKSRISGLSSGLRDKISNEYRDLLQFYPRVDKFAICENVIKDNPVIVGRFKNKVVMKCFVTDLMQYLQPTYIAVYLLEESIHQEHVLTSQVFEESADETVEVILIPRAQI